MSPKLNKRAMWLLRELTGETSPDSILFRVVVEGEWHEEMEGYQAIALDQRLELQRNVVARRRVTALGR